ncbi:putative cytosol aminopeptidase 1 [Psychrosphaera saromensis]|nr:leucyl aminopeptidase [Psychrosphaera saromensis]GHB75005.1 putative cytosol aminopeptidase 1 [Psychrosphaera saromensis]GLQ12686.1 putative cytosol aminopeptidase 1 [Psychrosphaera saromensis]
MLFKLSRLVIGLTALTCSSIAAAEKITFETSVSKTTDTLVVFHGKNQSNMIYEKYNKKANGQLDKAIAAINFKGNYGKFIEILAPNNLAYQRVVIVGTGEKTLSKDKLTKLGANLSAKLEKKSISNITIAADDLDGSNAETSALLAHGISLRAYSFDKYLKEKRQEKNYYFDVSDGKAATKAYLPLSYIESGVFLARDLTNETGTAMTPVEFVEAAKTLKKYGVKIKVLTPKELKKLNMNALEGVGRGSLHGARLIIAHYEGNNDTPIVLAGKGITFDTGGYNIKTKNMVLQKKDMGGAATALGTVKALAMMKAKVNVVAVMGMAANMVSEKAILPGDVLLTAEGISVEVISTDAEGRLALSDAMWYARKNYNPEIMIDIATLTGSKIGAVGTEYGAIFSADDQLVQELTFAGKQVNEHLWRLPLGYKGKLKSDIADLRNTGTGGPGATTAATFLQHFAGDTKWAHLDIAGNALIKSAKDESPKGATGYGVRLLTEWILTREKQ